MASKHRFLERYEAVTETGCWLWTARTDRDGYGQFWADGRQLLAHRFAWALWNGPIPYRMLVCHKCDTPSCVNPTHLFLGTVSDNNADRDAKGRAADRRGSKHALAKLTEAQAVAVFLDFRPCSALAARFGVSVQTVRHIKSRYSWAHATAELLK